MRRGRNLFRTVLLFLCLFLAGMGAQAAGFSKTAPAPKTAAVGTQEVTLKWKKRSGLLGYQVYRTDAEGKSRKLVKTTGKTTARITGLRAGKTFYFQVRGYTKKNGRRVYTNYSRTLRVKTERAGTSTIKNLLLTALRPAGQTMYVWGGGWNEADTGAGTEAVTLGVSARWRQFFLRQTSAYDYQTALYQIHDGLDCSGYIGWVVYNAFETRSGKSGYVMQAKDMASDFAARGWGSLTEAADVKSYRAGDIMSCATHVYMVVGACGDGSVVVLHSSPPGVRLCGTPSAGGRADSQAVRLAERYMKKYFPDWYAKYPDCKKDGSYLTDYAQMRWDTSGSSVMTDPDGYQGMSAAGVLKDLFASR